MKPEIKKKTPFTSGREAVIRSQDCTGCGICKDLCRFDAIREAHSSTGDSNSVFEVDPLSCEGCGVCVHFCPEDAIDFNDRLCGEWYISETRAGPMVHAKLGIAAENSGKLVTTVRQEAQKIGNEKEKSWLLVDGSPGIGCPVIASITGADGILVVTEPTVSGLHDLKRLLTLSEHFKIPTAVCVNKWDINPEAGLLIEEEAKKMGAKIMGRLGYDKLFTQAQVRGKAIVEEPNSAVAEELKEIWKNIKDFLAENKTS